MEKGEIVKIIENLANGIDPVTGQPGSNNNILESAVVVRALFNAASIIKNTNTPVTQTDNRNAGKVIKFYRINGSFGYLSNFSKYPILLENKQWLTSEHYFQAKKFEGSSSEEEIRLIKTPKEAAKLGRQRSRPLRDDWESVKESVMYAALKAKFTQHQDLKRKLISTGNATIVEHTKNDSYWGDAGDGTGKNRLGILLMKLRSELQQA